MFSVLHNKISTNKVACSQTKLPHTLSSDVWRVRDPRYDAFLSFPDVFSN